MSCQISVAQADGLFVLGDMTQQGMLLFDIGFTIWTERGHFNAP